MEGRLSGMLMLQKANKSTLCLTRGPFGTNSLDREVRLNEAASANGVSSVGKKVWTNGTIFADLKTKRLLVRNRTV